MRSSNTVSCRLESVARVSGPGLQNSNCADYQTGGKEDCQKHAVFALGVVFGQPCNVCTVFGLMGIHAFLQRSELPGEFVIVRYPAHDMRIGRRRSQVKDYPSGSPPAFYPH